MSTGCRGLRRAAVSPASRSAVGPTRTVCGVLCSHTDVLCTVECERARTEWLAAADRLCSERLLGVRAWAVDPSAALRSGDVVALSEDEA